MKTSGNFWKNVGAIGGGLLIVFHMFRPYIIREVNHTLNRLNHTHFLAKNKKGMVTKGEIAKTFVDFREKFPKGESGLSNDSKSAKASKLQNVETKKKENNKSGNKKQTSQSSVSYYPCSLCNQSGFCSSCHGSRYISNIAGVFLCGACWGSGKCQACNGEGWVTMKIFNDGTIISSSGMITPDGTMYTCDGITNIYSSKGDAPHYSDNTNSKYSENYYDDECPICHGSRKCYNCGGRGEKEYEMIFTGGQIERHDCSICEGNGRCPSCHGSGKMR